MFRHSHSHFNHHSPSTSSSSPPRSSRTTTPELDMLGGGRRGDGILTPTTATSVYSDGLTEVPPLSSKHTFNHQHDHEYDDYDHDEVYQDGIVKEGKLIDYEQDQEEKEEEFQHKGMDQNPTDKLRELLKQMKQEIEITKPTTSLSSTNENDGIVRGPDPRVRDYIGERKDWRRSLLYGNIHNGDEDENGAGPSSRGISHQRRMKHDDAQEADNEEEDIENQRTDEEEGSEQEQESPPTPPPRIGNPYANRRNEQRRNSPTLNQPGRLPSRAAVLRNSTSRSSPSPEPPTSTGEPDFKSPPTRLEAFLASSASSLPPPPPDTSYPAESLTSYSRLHHSLARRDSGSSSSSSRKGKNRAISPIPPLITENQSTSISRRSRYRHTPTPPPPELPYAESRSRRAAHTPRRISVDLAPEDLNSFARNAVDLEVRGEVELDLDEGFSGIRWEESSQSMIEEDVKFPLPPPTRHIETRSSGRSRSISRSPERGERSTTYKPRSSSPTQETNSDQRHSQPQQSPPNYNHTAALRQNRKTPTPPHINRSSSPIPPKQHSSPSPTLPALPEPDLSANSDTSEVDTYSSRRAALFHSTSKSASASASTPNSRSISTLRDKSQSQSPSYGTPLGSNSRLSNRRSNFADKEKDEEEYYSPLPPKTTVSPELERSSTNRSSVLPTRTQANDDTPIRPNQSSKRPSPSSESPHRIPIHPSSSKRYTPPRNVEDIPIPTQEPIQVNLALKSSPSSISTTPYSTEANLTPIKSTGNPNLSAMPTPKPPGAWQSTPKGKVRFNPSPLGKSSPVRANTSQLDQEGVSIHRLRISPRRSPKKTKILDREGEEGEVGNNSFLGKLAESISSPLKKARLAIPIPPKSTTFTIHTTSLRQAKSATQAAEEKLALTQKQWLEALSAINAAAASASGVNVDVGMVVKKSWGWGTWILWGLVEIVVIWSVFRVTIDYATSLTHLSSLDPFHPLALPFRQPSSSYFPSGTSSLTWGNGPFGATSGTPIKLDITIPSALQTLVGKSINMRNANFFDLIESWGIWNNFGLGMGMGGGEGLGSGGDRILGGIPT